MTTQLFIGKDRLGQEAFILNDSDENFNALLAADTLQSISIPSDAHLVYIFTEQGANVYSSFTTIAALPSSGTFGSDALRLNATGYSFDVSETTLFLRSVAVARVNVIFYK